MLRWSIQSLFCVTLAAVFSSAALGQHGFSGGGRGQFGTSPGLSSTSRGAGASIGPGPFPSSTAIGAGAPPRPGFASRGFVGSTGSFNGGGYFGNRNTVVSRSSYARGRRGDYRSLPFSYFLAPYYYPFLDYGSAPYAGAPEDLPPDPNMDAIAAQNLLGEQVMRLTAELHDLKSAQQQGAIPTAAGSGQPEPPPPAIPVTVVLRNGQKLQVQNYAIMDQTFWDFSKQPARKIPISNIDLSASTEATAAAGGEFPQLSPAR